MEKQILEASYYPPRSWWKCLAEVIAFNIASSN
jgi:hypothetical protein